MVCTVWLKKNMQEIRCLECVSSEVKLKSTKTETLRIKPYIDTQEI